MITITPDEVRAYAPKTTLTDGQISIHIDNAVALAYGIAPNLIGADQSIESAAAAIIRVATGRWIGRLGTTQTQMGAGPFTMGETSSSENTSFFLGVEERQLAALDRRAEAMGSGLGTISSGTPRYVWR